MTKNKTGAPFGGHLPGLDGLRAGAMTLGLPAAAVASHHAIEQPMQQRVLRLLDRRRRAPGAADGTAGLAG